MPVWHVVHGCEVGIWFAGMPPEAPAKLVKLLWQVEQSALVAMCVVGFETGVTPVKLLPLWQVAQPDVMPVWFMAVPGPKTVVALWQVAQSSEVGKCVAGLETGVTPVKDCPLWQVAHPVVMPV